MDSSDVVVQGAVLTVDNTFANRLREIRFIVTGSLKGAYVPGDTISILQITPPGDPTGVRYYEWAFAPGQSLEVYLINVSGPPYWIGDVYDPTAPDIALPTGTYYYVWALEDGVIPLGGGGGGGGGSGLSTGGAIRWRGDGGNGFSSVSQAAKCCIWIHFIDNCLECDGKFPGTEASQEATVTSMIQQAYRDAGGPDCPIIVTGDPGCTAGVIIDIVIGQDPAKGPNGRPVERKLGGLAKDFGGTHETGTTCQSGTVLVFLKNICNVPRWGDKDNGGSKDKVARAAGNIATHEGGHEFGCPHGDGGVMWSPRGKAPLDAGDISYPFSPASKQRIRECCCPPTNAQPTTWGRIKVMYK